MRKHCIWGPGKFAVGPSKQSLKRPLVDRPMASAPMVSLHVTLQDKVALNPEQLTQNRKAQTLKDKGQSTAVGGCASLDTCVWTLGEQVGMLLGRMWFFSKYQGSPL